MQKNNVKMLLKAILRTLIIRLLPGRLLSIFGYKCDFIFIANLPNLEVVPKNIFCRSFLVSILKYLPPLFVAPVVGFKDRNNKDLFGWSVICFLTAKQIMHDFSFTKKKILQVVALADKLNTRIVSLGAFTSIAVHDGFDLIGKTNAAITTGNTYSAVIAIQNAKDAINLAGKIFLTSKIAIVGAAGSVGSGCAKYLSREVKNLILIDINLPALKKIVSSLEGSFSNITISDDLSFISDADVVIVVTNSVNGFVDSRFLKQQAIVVDGASPQNILKETIINRKDVTVISSAIVYASNVSCDFNFGLNEHEFYGCLAEALILMWLQKNENYSLGKVSLEQMLEMELTATRIGFRRAKFRNICGYIEGEKLRD